MKHLSKIILALTLSVAFNAHAQTAGSDMNHPIVLGSGQQTLIGQNPVGAETWYMWQTISPGATFELNATQLDGPFVPVSAEVHILDPNGIEVFHDSTGLGPDSALEFRLGPLRVNYSIYFKIISPVCSSCNQNTLTAFDVLLKPDGCWTKWYFDNPTPGNEVGSCYEKTGNQQQYDTITICASTHLYFQFGHFNSIENPFDVHVFTGPPSPAVVTPTTYASVNSPFLVPFPGPGVYCIVATGAATTDDPTSSMFGSNNITCCELIVTVVPDPVATFTISPIPTCTGQVCFTATAVNDPIYDKKKFVVTPNNSNTVIAQSGPNVTSFCVTLPANTTFISYKVTYSVSSSQSSNFPQNFPQLGCSASSVQFFTVYSPPDIPAVTASSTNVCSGSSVILTASSFGATAYTWMPGSAIGSNVTVNPTVTTTYTVIATNPAGCSATQTITINVHVCCLNPKPNSYTFSNVTLVPFGTNGATPWAALTPGPVFSGNIALPPGGLIPAANFTILGNLTINAPATFNNTDAVFQEASQVIQNQPMTIDHSWWRACDYMWSGIESRNYIKITNSIIEDANVAVRILFVGSHPGMLIDNDLFNKNNYGIGIIFASVNTFSPNNFKITGSIFTCKRNFPSSLYNPFQPTQFLVPVTANFVSTLVPNNGIVLGTITQMTGSNVLSIPIGTDRSNIGIVISGQVTTGNYFNIGNSNSNNAQNKLLTNYFSFLNTGIYNSGSKIYVVNSNFQQIVNFGGSNALAGIYHDNTGGTGSITNVGDLNSNQKKCVFQSDLYGIVGVNGGNMSIVNNTFQTITGNAIQVSQWNNPNGEVDVLQNTFTNSNLDFYAYNNVGIKAIVQGNTSTGSYFYPSSNVSIQELTPSVTALYRIDGNDFTGKATGIYLNTVNNANITDNTIKIAKNNSTSIFTAGIWNENCLNILMSNNSIKSQQSNSSTFQASGIYTSASSGNTYCSNDVSEFGALLRFQGACNPSNIYSNTLDKGFVGILLDQNANTGNIGVNSGNNWYASENIFGNTLAVSTYCQNTSNNIQAKIYYNTGNGPVPTSGAVNASFPFAPVNALLIAGGPVCPSATFRMMHDSAISHPTILESLSYIAIKENYYLANMYSQYQYVLTPAVMINCHSTNVSRFYEIDSLTNDYLTTRNIASLVQAQTLNNAIVTQNIFEQNQSEFNTIYHTCLSHDSLGMLGRLNDLRTLAEKCPYTDGNAVYQARALLSHYDTLNYFSECERSTAPEGFGSNQPNAENAAAIYPNPAREEVFIVTNADGGKVEIYNLLGVRVAVHTISKGENKIDISEISSGAYFFKIIGENAAVIKTEKVIITNQ